ncbi:MAG: LuxR C-terminal-related transcriptional regulator [Vicinamibacterales bacterium]
MAVVIVTGTPALGSGLAYWIDSDAALAVPVVTVVTSGDELLTELRRLLRDVGVVVCADRQWEPILGRLTFHAPNARALVLVEDCSPVAEARILRGGANMVMPADSLRTDFVSGVNLLAHRQGTVSGRALDLLRRPAHGPLTERQRQILEMLERGLRPKEIAERLTISLNTVKTHIERLRGRLAAPTEPTANSRRFATN